MEHPPVINFHTRICKTSQSEEKGEITCIQLVKPGDTLLTLKPVFADGESGEAKKRRNEIPTEIQQGENCVMAEDGESISATEWGYPDVACHKGTKLHLMEVSVRPLLSISDDGMKLHLSLHPHVENSPPLDLDILQQIAGQKAIKAKLNHKIIIQALELVKKADKPFEDFVIAKGLKPIDGEDAKLRFEIEIGPVAGKVLGNGSIDFRERRMFVAVAEGQLVARKIPATAGTPGEDILGELIQQEEGVDLVVKVSDDASFDNDSGEIRALKSGILSVVKGNSIKVSGRQIIQGDIDYSTGNIHSRSVIAISGSILPSFKVQADGDILVGGSINSATVESAANIVVKGGILGETCKITAAGDIDLKFIEHATIRAGCNLIIRNEGYYCTLECDGDIRCHSESRLVGAHVLCAGNFSGGTVGSKDGAHCTIIAGVDRKKYAAYLLLQQKEERLEKEIINLKQLCAIETDNNKKINQKQAELLKLQRQKDKFNLKPDHYQEAKIEIIIEKTIFAGTELRIENCSLKTEDTFRKVKFQLDENKRKIIPIEMK